MNPFPFRPFRLALAVLIVGSALPVLAQEAKPGLVLESVKVEPASPSPETLCHLSVTLRNAGERRASALEFAVKVNGQEIRTYKDRLYLEPLEPGATREIRLFNFWSSEAGRPVPVDGKVNVEVTLHRASWMAKEAKDGAEVWTPLGATDGLPARKSLALTLGKMPR
jgi:hypothetical protein